MEKGKIDTSMLGMVCMKKACFINHSIRTAAEDGGNTYVYTYIDVSAHMPQRQERACNTQRDESVGGWRAALCKDGQLEYSIFSV